MTTRFICPLTCPMLNQFRFCESAMRRVDRVIDCPHNQIGRAVSKLDTRRDEKERRCV